MKRSSRVGTRATGALRSAFLAPLVAYQRLVSPALPARCKYHPTCSSYAIQAVRELGILRGIVVAGWRLLRCNPWSHGGVDELANRPLFRPRGSRREPGDRASRVTVT